MIRDPIRYLILAGLLLAIDMTVKDVPTNISDIRLRALLDNTGHIATAIVAWFMVRSCKAVLTDRLLVFESALCGLLSCLLDFDHFIEAGSLDLAAATSLAHRPFLHCSTILIFAFVIMLLVSLVCRIGCLHTFSFLCFTAWSTHHMRDGLRRGIWFCPWTVTTKLHYDMYVVVLLLLPILISQLMDLTALFLVMRSRKADLLSKRRDSTESEKLLSQDLV